MQFGDVLIVGRALLPIKPDSALVRAMEAHGIPVSVVVRGSGDLKEGELDSDTVLVTNTYNGHGLERSVVVFVPDIQSCSQFSSGHGDDWCGRGLAAGGVIEEGVGAGVGAGGVGSGGGVGDSDGYMERLGKLNQMGMWFIVSRCLAHLVIFHV